MGMPGVLEAFCFRSEAHRQKYADFVYCIHISLDSPRYGIPYMDMHTLLLTWNAILSGAFESPTDDIALGRRSKARHEATEFRHGTSEQGQSPRDKSHDE